MQAITALASQLTDDINRPEGRWGLHGHSAVDDDYFAALQYVVEKIGEIIGPNRCEPCSHDGSLTRSMEPVSRCDKCGMVFIEDHPIT